VYLNENEILTKTESLECGKDLRLLEIGDHVSEGCDTFGLHHAFQSKVGHHLSWVDVVQSGKNALVRILWVCADVAGLDGQHSHLRDALTFLDVVRNAYVSVITSVREVLLGHTSQVNGIWQTHHVLQGPVEIHSLTEDKVSWTILLNFLSAFEIGNPVD
jgi:hypothetical protein